MLIKTLDKKKFRIVLNIVLICLIIGVQWFQLEYSAADAGQVFGRAMNTILLSVGLLFCLNGVIAWAVGRWWIALFIGSVIVSIVSIVNHYVILFHGAPFVYSELVNALTAKNVLSGFSIPITNEVICLSAMLALEILLAMLTRRVRLVQPAEDRRKYWLKKGAYLALLVVAVCWIYHNNVEVAILWSWEPAVEQYGYICYALDDFKSMQTAYNMPEGYSEDKIEEMGGMSADADLAEYPDVILILNETFYDLEVYTEVDADKEYLDSFFQIENAIHGYAIVPSPMSTNKSEYELLTSNSMYLLNSAAPFNNLDMSGSQSVVQYFNALGYETWALHAADSANYSRNRAYPALGFDNTLFIEDMHVDQYGNRYITDEANYQDLIECYESAEGPQFMYLLTFQNHGGYEQNDASYDLVHTTQDFGSYTEQVNEFLTSVSMSNDAFVSLVEYFENVDRPVIIAMVGDHAPSFIYNIDSYEDMSETERLIAQSEVPYIIWANFEIDLEVENEVISMVDIIPLTLKAVGLPMTSYYQYIYDMQNVIPVRTSYGTYIDAENNIGVYGQDSDYYEILSSYYYMEYNNIKRGYDYIEDLFVPNIEE